jgi:ubiquinone biosynthesis protein COQ4
VRRGAKQTWGFRLSPRQWPSLARAVRATPEDVALGARIFFAVGGHDEGPTYRRMLRTPAGKELAHNRTGYPKIFTDYDRLRTLPEGTLGREYVRQLDERDIHPVGIIKATAPAYEGIDFTPDHAYARDRLRDIHDLFHALTGYGIDMNGEGALAAFTFAQAGNKGWAMLAFINLLTGFSTGRLDGARVLLKGYLRGRRARYIIAENDWDRLFQLPIEQARAELGIPPFEPYRPLELDEVFASVSSEAG